MNLFSSILIGFGVTSLTTLLPGLINMTVAKVSLSEGKSKARALSIGAGIIVFFQAVIGTIFARFIDKRADIHFLIQEIGIGIFVVLSIYFFFFSKRKKENQPEITIRSNRSHLFRGFLLSVINVFPIPFYVLFSVTMASYGYFQFEKPFILLFGLGSALGALSIFYLYANYIKKIEHRTDFFLKNVNYLLGSVTLFIAVIGIVKLLNE